MSWPVRGGSGGGGGEGGDTSGLMVKAANLSDVASPAAARANIAAVTSGEAVTAAQAVITLAALGGTTAAAALAAAQGAITLGALGGTTAAAALSAAQGAITLAALGGTTAAAAASAAATVHPTKANNLSDVANTATALANLGGMGATSTTTVTNKRNVPRVLPLTGAQPNPTYNTDNLDVLSFTTLTGTITNMSTNMTGTPNPFEQLVVNFNSAGAVPITSWGANYESGAGLTLPTITVAGQEGNYFFQRNTANTKWRLMGIG